LLAKAAARDSRKARRVASDVAAAAFASNDYYDSDVKWMALSGAIEPTIGPYEVYEDEWFNYKAAFEAFITVKDAAESARLNEASLCKASAACGFRSKACTLCPARSRLPTMGSPI